MRIISHNLFEGAENTYSELKGFMAHRKPDIACLQETNGWGSGTPSRASDFKDDLKFSSGVLAGSNTRFELATFSGLLPKMTAAYRKGFWHAAIHTAFDLDGELLHVWNVHLHPKGEDERLEEVGLLANYIGLNDPATFGPDGLVLITGDFNSLSREDNYPDQLLDDLTKQNIPKFGTDRLRYDVTDYLTGLGLVDIAAERGEAVSTVPTPANRDTFHAADLRLDYMFASRALLERVTGFSVIKDPVTDILSDHYPIELALE
jgi:endonuclease/exonuclease/phosphatase family metal-dependent hydrolase